MKQSILTFDLGTSSVKTSLFSDSLELLHTISVEYTLDAAHGLVQVDPARYLEAMAQGIRQLPPSALAAVGAIGLTSQGETLIPVDSQGKPLTQAIVWLDNRAGGQAQYIASQIPLDTFRHHTGLPAIDGALPLSKLLWLQQMQPDIYNKAHQFLLVEDFVIHRLTGVFCTEKSLQSSTGYFDLQADTWWNTALRVIDMDAGKLPPLLNPGEVAGRLLPGIARQLGLPGGIPVCTGAMDQTAAALAAGCNAPGRVLETTGSALVVTAYAPTRSRAQGSSLTVYRHALPDACLLLGIGNTGGLALKWLKDQFFAEGWDYETLSDLAASVSPGSDGLLFLPFLSGCINPLNVPQARAAFIGASLATSRAHFVRAVMEGVAFLLLDLLHEMESAGILCTQVCSLGGGARSPLWQQIKADVCNRSFRRLNMPEAASRGAAWLAAKAVGWTAAQESPQGQSAGLWTPRAEQVKVYDEAFTQYRQAFDAVMPLYTKGGKHP